MLLATSAVEAEQNLLYRQALTRLQDEYNDLMLNIQTKIPN